MQPSITKINRTARQPTPKANISYKLTLVTNANTDTICSSTWGIKNRNGLLGVVYPALNKRTYNYYGVHYIYKFDKP